MNANVLLVYGDIVILTIGILYVLWWILSRRHQKQENTDDKQA